ncbi:BgTH12-01468 [Blumeria graminis f. sp. triticale]|uniref:Spindle pole body component n=1 Tax=Blumeria graminis f. sp. triticale TaxID=1689686 RepID=A0A9W4CZ51_BLUGR|nr:BgTH12-01468 [Blumeria graminis f. sp. triticale]
MTGSDAGDVFYVPDFWARSELSLDAASTICPFFSVSKLQDIEDTLPPLEFSTADEFTPFGTSNLGLNIPSSFQTQTRPKIILAARETSQEYETIGQDIWLCPGEFSPKYPIHQTWDEYGERRSGRIPNPYITEAGATIFDAAITDPDDRLGFANDEFIVINRRKFVQSLLALGLGRSSVLFLWDEERHSFTQTAPRLRTSGLTGDILIEVLTIFIECGNITKSLRKYVDKCYNEETSPARIALADSVLTLLKTIQLHLKDTAFQRLSIIQLKTLFNPVHSILTCFQKLVNNTAASRSDESLLSTIFEDIQVLEQRSDSLRSILLEVLTRVSQPWLDFVSEWIGLLPERGLPMTNKHKRKSLVTLLAAGWVEHEGTENIRPEYVLDSDKIPSFIASDDARTIFEIGKSLRLLKVHHPSNPLVNAEIIAHIKPPHLKWKFSWHEISQVEATALQYEETHRSMKHALFLRSISRNTPEIHLIPRPIPVNFTVYGKQVEAIEASVSASISIFDQILDIEKLEDNLSRLLNSYFNSTTTNMENKNSIFAPPISIAPVLSFNPIVAVQARIINGTCMKMLFQSHRLRDHLNMLKQFYLLNHGVFSTRLSHILFRRKPESLSQSTTQQNKVASLRTHPNNWPPASPELLLELSGILVESYYHQRKLPNKSLPGNLSFAIRDMSQEQMTECMKPDGIEALDFLCLSYKPPAPLDVVITPLILFKYDQLFKFLLRIRRLLHVVSNLFWATIYRSPHPQPSLLTAQRFQMDATHFMSSISGYFFDTGVSAAWQIFERKLDQVESFINNSEKTTSSWIDGLDKFRDYHERVLDRIMFVFLLRKRQKSVLHLLEEIFGLILQFSSEVQGQTRCADGLETDAEIKTLYITFRRKVAVFITVLRGLREKKGYGETKNLETRGSLSEGIFACSELIEENTIAQLLSRLEMSDYFENHVHF